MWGEIFGCSAGLEETLGRLRRAAAAAAAASFFPIAPELCGSRGEVCREGPLDVGVEVDGFSDGVNEDVLLPELFSVGAAASSFGSPAPFALALAFAFAFAAAAVVSGVSTSRFRYSEVSMDIGGMSSVGKLVFGILMSEAGVTGAFNGFWDAADPSSVGDRELSDRRGGGAIRTSGRGSGETDSLDECSWLCGCWIGVLCCETTAVAEFLRPLPESWEAAVE